MGGATLHYAGQLAVLKRFNPRFPWGERLRNIVIKYPDRDVSIHASRGGSDRQSTIIGMRQFMFQSTLPVGGATPLTRRKRHKDNQFQSTLPVGGATMASTISLWSAMVSIHASRGGSDLLSGCRRLSTNCGFNPRFPWGERPFLYFRYDNSCSVSIHASRGGSDNPSANGFTALRRFQSTLPVGGATGKSLYFALYLVSFNPRFPWGERRCRQPYRPKSSLFQSTLPVGGATL